MKGDTLFSIILSFNPKYNFLFEVYNITTVLALHLSHERITNLDQLTYLFNKVLIWVNRPFQVKIDCTNQNVKKIIITD